MSYDDASWHSGGEFPKDLPLQNGGTHIGMFLAWAINNRLEGVEHQQDCPGSVQAVRSRQMTGRQFLFRECDGKLSDSDLNDQGNGFAKFYYSSPTWLYLKDYNRAFTSSLPTIYHVEDTWENYETIAPIISGRYSEWRTAMTHKIGQ